MGDKKIKAWQDSPSTATPITAAELIRVESRNRDLRWNCPASWTSIDEFDDDTVDGAWVRVDGTGAPMANTTWSELSDSLGATFAGQTATIGSALMRPVGSSVEIGDAFVTCINPMGHAANQMTGLILSDGTTHGAGSQVMAMSYRINAQFNYEAVPLSGFTAAAGVGTRSMFPQPLPFYLRLVKVTSTTWRADMSANGVRWISTSANATKSFTPTHVGFFVSTWGASAADQGTSSFDFLRRVSGVS